ncbi:hypothetical protein PanWU01x14_052470, partial [Parasponia andersonii]
IYCCSFPAFPLSNPGSLWLYELLWLQLQYLLRCQKDNMLRGDFFSTLKENVHLKLEIH